VVRELKNNSLVDWLAAAGRVFAFPAQHPRLQITDVTNNIYP
jgi:hypothetical protein